MKFNLKYMSSSATIAIGDEKMTKNNKKARIMVILSMLIFGTIGVLVKNIPLPSSVIALARSAVGAIFLILLTLITGKKIAFSVIGKNFMYLLPAGIFLGVNWILLFESYRHTTVAVATVCYYLAPVFIVLASPIILGERLTIRKMLFSAAALFGIVLVSGAFESGGISLMGILLASGAAALYAAIVLLNKKLDGISSNDATITQLAITAVILSVYVGFTEDFSSFSLTVSEGILLAVAGVVHTGIAYALYFGAVQKLDAQTSAIYSYIDPVCAVILSAAVLGEPMTLITALGAILVLGSTFLSEIMGKKAE